MAVVLGLVGTFYLWIPLSSTPTDDAGSYYSLLAQGFLDGHLYLPVKPKAELLALPDPYDPSANEEFRLHDASLFQNRYYLYFGPTPALLAMPGALTGLRTDMRVVTALLALVLVIESLWLVRRLAPVVARVHGTLFAVLVPIMLAFGSLIPIALRRVAVYEVAIISGACLAVGSVLALTYALKLDRSGSYESRWLALVTAGTLAGLAVWTRPPWLPLIATTVVLLAATSPRLSSFVRTAVFYLAPVLAIGTLAAIYNFERFGDPLEFGNRFQLAGIKAGTIRPSTLLDVAEKLRIDLFAIPQTLLEFPYFELSTPAGPIDLSSFYAEPSVGLFIVVPAIPLMILTFIMVILRRRGFFTNGNALLLLLPVTALLVLVTQGLALPATTFRYLLEVSPVAAVFAVALATRSLNDTKAIRIVAVTALTSLVAITVPLVGLLSMTGYYNTLQSGSPSTWHALLIVTSPLSKALGHLAS